MSNKKIEDVVREVSLKQHKVLEDFAKAYMAETGLKASEIVLCQQQLPDKIKFWFESKEEAAKRIPEEYDRGLNPAVEAYDDDEYYDVGPDLDDYWGEDQ